MTSSTEFITLADLAVAAGDKPEHAEIYLDEMVNDIYTILKPYALEAGEIIPVRRADLAGKYYYDRRWDLRVRQYDVDKYLAARDKANAAEAEAAKYTTSDRLTWSDPEDRDRTSHGHPVYAADGTPAFDKFRHAGHVASWLATGGSLTSEDIDAEINARLTELMDKDTK
jgi:hypothetical protein